MDNTSIETEKSGGPAGSEHQPVWTFRGYELRPGEFNTAMVHFYRAEIQRANTWRNRLDATTNWAIITSSAGISFALSSPSQHHGVILLNMLLVAIFLYIEARRYRYYELWSYRTRLMETDFFAAMLVPPFRPSPGWAEALARSLRKPKFTISIWEALGRRFRRNYFAIFMVLILVWLFKTYSQPTAATNWAEFIERARLAPLPGEFTVAVFVFIFVGMVVLAVATLGLQAATGEVLTPVRMRGRARASRGQSAEDEQGDTKDADR
jgi:uncharacterized membrane protein